MSDHKCCYIYPNSDKMCQSDALWTICSGFGIGDYTESCTLHIGLLLGDAYEHRIYSIDEPEGLNEILDLDDRNFHLSSHSGN